MMMRFTLIYCTTSKTLHKRIIYNTATMSHESRSCLIPIRALSSSPCDDVVMEMEMEVEVRDGGMEMEMGMGDGDGDGDGNGGW